MLLLLLLLLQLRLCSSALLLLLLALKPRRRRRWLPLLTACRALGCHRTPRPLLKAPPFRLPRTPVLLCSLAAGAVIKAGEPADGR